MTRSIADLNAEAKATQARLEDEERLAALVRSADLVAPVGGMIWRLGASNVERLGVGDMAAELVDCGAPELLVAVPQDRFSDIKIGGVARYRLSGERVERTGPVLSVIGQGDLSQTGHYAALPIAEARSTIIAKVAMTPAGFGEQSASCLIGRTARVLLPTSAGGPVDRLLRHFF